MPTRPEIHRTASIPSASRHTPEGADYAASFYNSAAWRRCRHMKLRQSPLCERCKSEPAVDVHHIKPLRDNRGLRLTIANLESLCKKCHAIHHKAGGHA